MKKFERWMVGIDVAKSEINLLKNVATLADQFRPKQIHLVTVRREVDIPKEVLMDIPDLLLPDTKQTQETMEGLVRDIFHPDQPVTVHVLSGNQLTELLKFENRHQIDLAILGRRDMSKVGVLSKKMVRKSACSVMLVPDFRIEKVNTILLPIDFSEYSNLAISMVDNFESDTLGPVVHALHVYKDATKYLSQVFETADEIDRILAKKEEINKRLTAYAEHELEDYLIKMGKPSIQRHIASIERGASVSQPIDKLINEIRPDLLIMGSKGKTTSATALLGEVSESMLPHNGNHMIMILKKSGENKGFLNSLLSFAR